MVTTGKRFPGDGPRIDDGSERAADDGRDETRAERLDRNTTEMVQESNTPSFHIYLVRLVLDTLGAFVPGPVIQRAPHGSGPLSGLSFAVKDLFDVAGGVTGCGNPDWAATHEIAKADAWAVDALLGAGASLTGKTVADEISLGLLGINKFYGTPLNPRAPDRVPGGSSSGSASAVAGGLADFALGTNSGGSSARPSEFLRNLRPASNSWSYLHRRHDAPGAIIRYRWLFHSRCPDFRPGRRGATRRAGRPCLCPARSSLRPTVLPSPTSR